MLFCKADSIISQPLSLLDEEQLIESEFAFTVINDVWETNERIIEIIY